MNPGWKVTGLVVGMYEYLAGSDGEEHYRDFFQVSSSFYPGLDDWYEEAIHEARRRVMRREQRRCRKRWLAMQAERAAATETSEP